MPTWVVLVSSIFTAIVIMGGAVSFPYIPMLLGVYGAERNSFRGTLIVKLIWLFPLVSIISLYIAWTSNSMFSVVPFAYVFSVWLIRANKDASSGPAKQYKTEQENAQAVSGSIEHNWNTWKNLNPSTSFLFLTIFTPTIESSTALKESISNTEKLHSETEENTYNNNTSTIYICLQLNSLEKEYITELTSKVLNKVWSHNCELVAIDIMEDDE